MYAYPLTVSNNDHWYSVTCPLIPELSSCGHSRESAVHCAGLYLPALLGAYITRNQPIPVPDNSQPLAGDEGTVLSFSTSVRVLLWNTLLAGGGTLDELAKRLNCSDTTLRYRLDPCRMAHADELEEAFAALGLRLTVAVEPL